MKINLYHNKAYHWFEKDGIFVKGYLFDRAGNFYKDEKLVSYFKGVGTIGEFKDRLKGASGLFSVIINSGNKTIAAVDPIRMFPLFYNTECVSDEANGVTSSISLDEKAKTDFLQTAYVTADRTLIEGVSQIQAGEAICFQHNKIDKYFYTSYASAEINRKTYPELKYELKQKLESAFIRIFELLRNKTIVIPLSAGYDSRLIAVMLKNSGFKKVICFTYGRKSYPEIETSKLVANRLGYSWHYIEYNDKLVDGFLNDQTFKEFFKFSANHVSMFYLQEFFAIKQLKEQALIPDDSVIISGHSGDFIAGSHLDGNIKPDSSIQKLATEIFNKNFGLLPHSSEYKKMKLTEIIDSFQKVNSFSHSLYENWDLMERQSKFIVNSCNTYNFFGYQHYLPFWDTDLMAFFKTIPFKLKLNKKLYDDVLKDFFEPHQLNLENEFQPGATQLKIQEQKNKIKKIIPDKLFQSKFLKNDPLCYWEATREMKKDMEERGFEVNHHYKELKAVFTQWYLSKL